MRAQQRAWRCCGSFISARAPHFSLNSQQTHPNSGTLGGGTIWTFRTYYTMKAEFRAGIRCNHTVVCFVRARCINRWIWVHKHKDLCCFETNWKDTVSTDIPNSTRMLRAYCTNVPESARTKMQCCVSCLQTQARLSYPALLIWQSMQEAGREHKYCLGWLLKTREELLIHSLLLCWKSPGSSCISSVPPADLSQLPAFQTPLVVAVAFKEAKFSANLFEPEPLQSVVKLVFPPFLFRAGWVLAYATAQVQKQVYFEA